jgi:twitching motility protein PilT
MHTDSSTHIVLGDWLRRLVEQGGSVLHLQRGQPPLGRVGRRLVPLTEEPIDGETLGKALDTIFDGAAGAVLTDLGDIGAAYAYPVNTAGDDGAVVRLLRRGPADLEALGLPEAAQSVFRETTDGFVLLAGRAHTGRSSTLSALLADRVAARPVHAAWIGDPPVFEPPEGIGRVTTFAVDVDTPSVAAAIGEASRLDVDALFVDPLHEAEAVDLAIRFAEAGGLVVATVTAHGVPEALWRLIDPLTGEARGHMNQRLSRVFRLALDHCLVPRADGAGRLAAFGVLHHGTPVPAAMIREDKCHQLNSAAMVANQHGMRSISQALLPRVLAGDCTEDEAVAAIPEPAHLLGELNRARSEDA